MISNDVKKQKLSPKFDPIWREDFKDLHLLSPAAFILRQLFRLSRDITTELSNLPDVEIQKETGFNRLTIRKARKELIQAGYIVPHGYHTYLIRPFRWTQNVQPNQNHLDTKCPSVGHKVSNHLDTKCPSVGHKVSNPIYKETEATKTDNVFIPILKDEIPSLRSLYPWDSRDNLKNHLMNVRGFTEAQVGKAFEDIYSMEYTGRQ